MDPGAVWIWVTVVWSGAGSGLEHAMSSVARMRATASVRLEVVRAVELDMVLVSLLALSHVFRSRVGIRLVYAGIGVLLILW